VDLIRASRGARWVAVMVLALAPPGAALAGDAGFEEFLHAFRRALADDDLATLASLTQLPFLYEGRNLDAAGFERAVPELFTPEVRHCLAQARPVAEDDRLVIFCAPYGFYFGRTARGWRLIEFMADGED
jgi:hypothetical protein